MAFTCCQKLHSLRSSVQAAARGVQRKARGAVKKAKRKAKVGTQKPADFSISDDLACPDETGKLLSRSSPSQSSLQTAGVFTSPNANLVVSHHEHKQETPFLSPAANEETLPSLGKGAHESFESRYWGRTSDIPSTDLRRLASKVLDPEGQLGGLGVWVSSKKQGSYNTVYIVQFIHGYKLAIKVPSAGHASRWRKEDASNLRSEALTMQYIRKNTKVPVPDVYRYSTVLENEIGAPYIVMDAMEGVSAHQIWYPDGHVTEETIETRLKLLQSIAGSIAGLQTLEFDKAGMLDFENDDLEKPTVGPVRMWREPSGLELYEENYKELLLMRDTRSFPPASTAKQYFSSVLKPWNYDSHDEDRGTGVIKMAAKALECHPFRKSLKSPDDETESFVIQHPDFNLQNILCDPETLQITGVVDWDLVRTVPRCVGFSAVPICLREDWLPHYMWPVSSILAVNQLDMYRDHYSKCLSEAMGGEGDCVFTKKSQIYTALDAAMSTNGSLGVADFVDKVLQYIFPCQSAMVLTCHLGDEEDGGPCEECIMERMPAFLDPEGRDPNDDSDESDFDTDESDTQASHVESQTTVSEGTSTGEGYSVPYAEAGLDSSIVEACDEIHEEMKSGLQGYLVTIL
ncbi:hypothetical protein BU16DRAFT_619104 [Lophium mytilinum]|uniref:Aminoglycoside phosphotransferase domain-containing protein n=1 Tax=Lophium mytilinum TaxID=390894 RepID=A0A6A6QP46_9PEZI|nr:hypothetical protein BU16DRAFT_619104 [Lophium mytilinum]